MSSKGIIWAWPYQTCNLPNFSAVPIIVWIGKTLSSVPCISIVYFNHKFTCALILLISISELARATSKSI